MAPTIAAVLGFIPTNIWRPLKKFLTKDGTIVFDTPFKMSTKYTPALLIVMMCLSFANQFIRNVEIDCSTGAGGGGGGGSSGRTGYSSGGGSGGGGGGDPDLNDFCWNYDTFIVAKALDPKMRGVVTYPGVSGYDKANDEIIRQRYYKQLWLILGILSVISFLPLFIWKFRGTKKIKALLDVSEVEAVNLEDTRVSYFLETIGFNSGFANHYLAVKTLSLLTPFIQWYYLCGFIGRLYRNYGLDVLVNFMDNSDPWPNPMDALFPKMAKCEWSRYGYGGDMEIKSAQCQLPMNNLTQWSFFIYWWWLALVFFINALSCVRLVFILLPPYRRRQYQSFVSRACREDIEKARTHTIQLNGQIVTKKVNKRAIINVQLGFGDWLVLDFMKKNMEEWRFREFIRKMVLTENRALQLQPIKTVCINQSMEGKFDKSGNGGIVNNAPNILEMESILLENGNCSPPLTYTSSEPTSDSDNNDQLLLTSKLCSKGQKAGWVLPTTASAPPIDMIKSAPQPPPPPVGFIKNSQISLNSQSPPPEYSINISKPVEIDPSAHSMNNNRNKKESSGGGGNKKPSPPSKKPPIAKRPQIDPTTRNYGFRLPSAPNNPPAPSNKSAQSKLKNWMPDESWD